jgi:hypothetical protein
VDVPEILPPFGRLDDKEGNGRPDKKLSTINYQLKNHKNHG